jgi:hypothetical protein
VWAVWKGKAMQAEQYAEAWVRQNYRLQPTEESLAKLLAEWLILRNESAPDLPLPTYSWYLPGPPMRPRCLRESLKAYRKDWKGQNPRSIGALIDYICEYREMDYESNAWKEQFRKYTAPDDEELGYPYDA